MIKFGNWHDKIGTSAENSPHREAPNRHIKGSKKYKEMISKGSKFADRYKNLPFKFSKPPKRTQFRRDVYMSCYHCHQCDVVNKYTAGKVCSKCSKYTSVNEGNTFSTEDELLSFLEGLGKTKL